MQLPLTAKVSQANVRNILAQLKSFGLMVSLNKDTVLQLLIYTAE